MELSPSHESMLATLKIGVNNSKNFMASVTEYHGGQIETEYLLTSDGARALLANCIDGVVVEYAYKCLISAWAAKKNVRYSDFRGTRVDLAVLNNPYGPSIAVEYKIRVRRFSHIKNDIQRLSRLIMAIRPSLCEFTLGVVIFQVHLRGRGKWYYADRILKEVKRIEDKLQKEFSGYVKENPGLSFEWRPLQAADEGAVGREIENEGTDDAAWGQLGHATRYHAILIHRQSIPDCRIGLERLRDPA